VAALGRGEGGTLGGWSLCLLGRSFFLVETEKRANNPLGRGRVSPLQQEEKTYLLGPNSNKRSFAVTGERSGCEKEGALFPCKRPWAGPEPGKGRTFQARQLFRPRSPFDQVGHERNRRNPARRAREKGGQEFMKIGRQKGRRFFSGRRGKRPVSLLDRKKKIRDSNKRLNGKGPIEPRNAEKRKYSSASPNVVEPF